MTELAAFLRHEQLGLFGFSLTAAAEVVRCSYHFAGLPLSMAMVRKPRPGKKIDQETVTKDNLDLI